MNDRVKEITEKIYNEGIVKSQLEADRIIAEAKIKADEIINQAKQKQVEILEETQQQSLELKSKSEAELRLAAQKFLSQLKLQITNVINTSRINGVVKDAFKDRDFVQEMILTIIKNWDPQSSDPLELSVILPPEKEKELSIFFETKTRETLERGIVFKFDPKIGSGFKIGPKDESYVLSFSDKDFDNYFISYFKDTTRNLLFNTADKE